MACGWMLPTCAILKDRGVGVGALPVEQHEAGQRRRAGEYVYLNADAGVGLGPDGPAGSNNDFNLFEEMDLAAKLQKVTAIGLRRRFTAQQAFEMATMRGARALAGKEIGSLEPGKRADMVLVRDRRSARRSDVQRVLAPCLRAEGSDVRSRGVNGRVVVRETGGC